MPLCVSALINFCSIGVVRNAILAGHAHWYAL